jgi:Tol biopolymer transport system component/O-antigen ligase
MTVDTEIEPRRTTGRRRQPHRRLREAALTTPVVIVCLGLVWVASQAGVKGLVALAAAIGLAAALILIRKRSSALMVGYVISLIVLQHKRIGPLFPNTESGALGMEISSSDVVILVMYIVWAVEGTLRRDLRRALRQPVFWAPLVGMALMTFSLFAASSVYLGISELFRLSWIYLSFLYFGTRVRTRREIGFILGALGFFAFVELVVVLLQWATGGVLGLSFLGVPTALTQRTLDIGAVGRPFGTIIHPVFLGDVLGMLALVALSLAVYLPDRRQKRLCLAAVPVCIVPIALANARGPAIALAVTTVLLGLVMVARHRLSARTIWIALGLCVLAVAASWPEVSKLIADNFGTHHLGVEIQARLQLNGVASRMIDSSPVVGVGLNNYTQVMNNFAPYPLLFPGFPAHNLYLLQLAETGFLGLGALIVVASPLWLASTRVSRSRDPLAAALGVGMAAILVFNFMEEMLSYSLREEVPLAIFWLFAGLMVAGRRVAFDERRKVTTTVPGQVPPDGRARRHRPGPRPGARTPRPKHHGYDRRNGARHGRPRTRRVVAFAEAAAGRLSGAPHTVPALVVRAVTVLPGRTATLAAHGVRVGRHASEPLSLGWARRRAVAHRGRHPWAWSGTRAVVVGVVLVGMGLSTAASLRGGAPAALTEPGLKVVFSAFSRTSGIQAVYTVDGDGSDLRQITPPDGDTYSWPEWAMGGQKVVYTVRQGPAGSPENIVMANADGSDPVQLTHSSWRVDQPKVSPDGTKVLFAAFWPDYPTVALYLLDLDTLEVTNLSATHGAGPTFDSDPQWTPSGQIIYAHSVLSTDGSAVTPPAMWLMNGDGSDPHPLTDDSYFNVDGAVSPDNQTLAYSSYRGPGLPTTGSAGDENPFDLKLTNWFVVLRTLTGGPEQILNAGEDCSGRAASDPCTPLQGVAANPQWSPDGTMVGFITIRSQDDTCICAADPDGSNAQVVFDSTTLAIDWFSWVLPGTPVGSAVLDPGQGQSPSQFLWGTSGSSPEPTASTAPGSTQQGPTGPTTLAVSPDDLWGHQDVDLPPSLVPVNARWSPDKTEIAFTADVAFNPADANPQPPPPPGQVRHVHFTLDELDPAFFPAVDPTSVLPEEQVFLLDVATGTVRQVTTPWTEDWEDALKPGEARANTLPSFSPDGRDLLVTNISDVDGESFILRIDLQTGAVVNLTNVTSGAVPVDDSGASYSPDGSQIAFSSVVGGDSQIFVMDADGTDVRQLTDDGDVNSSPAWSPDGRSLAYASYRGTASLSDAQVPLSPTVLSDWDLVRLDPVTGKSTVLTTSDGGMESPEWSPDGSRIAFLSMTPTAGPTPFLQPDIYVVGAGGGNAIALQPTPFLDESFFDWR